MIIGLWMLYDNYGQFRGDLPVRLQSGVTRSGMIDPVVLWRGILKHATDQTFQILGLRERYENRVIFSL